MGKLGGVNVGTIPIGSIPSNQPTIHPLNTNKYTPHPTTHTHTQRKHRELTPQGGPPDPSLYPLFRLLLPQQDPRAGKYRILAKQLGP